MKRPLIILGQLAIVILVILGFWYAVIKERHRDTPPLQDPVLIQGNGSSTDEESNDGTLADVDTPIENSTLYFTEKDCAGGVYISAIDEAGEDRDPLLQYRSSDGFLYAIIEGTREKRSFRSALGETCENTPTTLDAFQTLELGRPIED